VGSAARESVSGLSIGPRTLDQDFLLYGSVVGPDVDLARSDELRYIFVLRPLADLSPELVHPVTSRIVRVEWEAPTEQPPPSCNRNRCSCQIKKGHFE
jgi:7,8-dihydro-6-hydroxymethylpterin-pyrophosphokinase